MDVTFDPFQNTFSKLASSDKLQGSIERLAEKWEAKRKNLSEDSGSDDLVRKTILFLIHSFIYSDSPVTQIINVTKNRIVYAV